MSKLTDEVRDALGLRRVEGQPDDGLFKTATSSIASGMLGLAQRQLYAEMQAGQMDEKLAHTRRQEEQVATTTTRIRTRRIPDVEVSAPEEDSYEYVE